MVKSRHELRSIESMDEQFAELDRRLAAGETVAPPPDEPTDQPRLRKTKNKLKAEIRPVSDERKGPYLRLATDVSGADEGAELKA